MVNKITREQLELRVIKINGLIHDLNIELHGALFLLDCIKEEEAYNEDIQE